MNPEDCRRLVRDVARIPAGVEEMLRWEAPIIGFLRTATCDVTLRGQNIRADQPVLMLYASANRDEQQFGPTAGEFKVEREINPHLSFGFEELLRSFPDFTLAGEVVRHPSTLLRGIEHLPLEFDPPS